MKTSTKSTMMVIALAFFSLAVLAQEQQPTKPATNQKGANDLLILGLGDSLTHGTMDATNNYINTTNAYLELVADALAGVRNVTFNQPLFDVNQNRIDTNIIPTNLSVDGADIFTLEGLEYYKRVNAPFNVVDSKYMANTANPLGSFDDKYDKVIYPINVSLGGAASQMDAAEWWLGQANVQNNSLPTSVFIWAGNNDTSQAALGTGGENPTHFPLPWLQIKNRMSFTTQLLVAVAQSLGKLDFNPYQGSWIDRGMTTVSDFQAQFENLLDRLENAAGNANVNIFVMTLPYYGSVGYLFDSEDLEYYLRKVNPAYSVPGTFQRVTAPGTPITDYTKGDRVSFFTFGVMYMMLNSGESIMKTNVAASNSGLVLSESEQAVIRARIDAFNQIIVNETNSRGSKFHLVDTGGFLNGALTGASPITAGSKTLNRKWSRGSGFSLDGVHPSYTGHALIANYILDEVDAALGTSTSRYNLNSIVTTDPYVDNDGDGWVPGAGYPATGFTELINFFTDSNDNNSSQQAVIPSNAWSKLDGILNDALNSGSKRKTGDLEAIQVLAAEARQLARENNLSLKSEEILTAIEQAAQQMGLNPEDILAEIK